MPYYLTQRCGGSIDNPSRVEMQEALAELDQHDAEHPDAWLEDDDGRVLSAFESGLVLWTRPPGQTSYLSNVPRARVLELWQWLAGGQVDAIEALPWQPGNGPPLEPEELERRKAEADTQRLKVARAFYDKLGAERPDVRCRHASCPRGAVPFSVWCRPHHFASIMGYACPFTD